MRNSEKELNPKYLYQGNTAFGNSFSALKELNSKVSILQLLLQDYDIRTMPQWIGFTTTTACNLKCPHCQTHGTEEMRKIYNFQRWDEETLTRIPKESLPYAYDFCLTLNGEPLSTPGLKKKLDEWNRYGAKLHLTTNGTLFSKKMLINVLPIVGTISISIDGASEFTCEAIRLGANFKGLCNGIRLLTRTCELLSEINPDIRLAFTVMASNIRDMPELVRLSHILKVPSVDFYSLIVLFPHVQGEDINLHKSLYNYYAMKAQEEAKRLSINVNMPEIFPGIDGNSDNSTPCIDVIIQQLPENYYETCPSPESFLNHDNIEQRAMEISEIIENRALQPNITMKGEKDEEEFIMKLESFRALLKKKSIQMEILGNELGSTNYCENLFKRMFISVEGDVSPCCYPGRPLLGNINEHTVEECWNGTLYNNFRKEFYSLNPPDCCKNCPSLTRIPARSLLI